MDHSRCSELLPAYERGELAASDQAAVRDHLAGCEDCSLELRGLRALHAVAIEPLTGAERTLLRDRIAGAVANEETQQVVGSSSGRSGFWSRVAPALGGIAVIAVLLTGVVYMSAGGQDEAAQSGAGGDGTDTFEGASEAEDAAGGGGGAEAPEAAQVRDADVLWAGELGKVSHKRLSRSVRRKEYLTAKNGATFGAGDAVTSSEFGYRAEELSSDRTAHVAALQGQAEGVADEQIARCAEVVTESLPYSTVPVYGAVAELEGRRVLLLGFKWAEAGQRDLDEFMLWAWPIGDCGVPVFYGAGTPGD